MLEFYRILLVLVVILVVPHAGADVTVTWRVADGLRVWTDANHWGLDQNCGLYPKNGMRQCCKCQPDPRWTAVISAIPGPTMDVPSELAGVELLGDATTLNLNGYTLTVKELMKLGNPSDATPRIISTTQPGRTRSAGLVNEGTCRVIADVLFRIPKITNRGEWNIEDSAQSSAFEGNVEFENVPGAELVLQGTGSILNRGGGPHSVTNAGYLIKTGGGTSRIEVGFSQSTTGRMRISSGDLELAGISKIRGKVAIHEQGELRLAVGAGSHEIDAELRSQGRVTFGAQNSVTVRGVFDVARAINEGSLTVLQTTALAKDFTMDGGRLEGRFKVGHLDWRAGTAYKGYITPSEWASIGTNSSTPVLEHSVLRIDRKSKTSIGRLRGINAEVLNYGDVVLTDGPLDAQPAGNAHFRNKGTFVIHRTPVIDWRISNEGEVLLATTGPITLRAHYRQTAGSTTFLTANQVLRLDTGKTFTIAGGTLSAQGRIEGNIAITGGHLTLGDEYSGMLELAGGGQFTLGSGAQSHFDIGGRNKGTGYDAVYSATPISLTVGGNLAVVLTGWFRSRINQSDRFEIFGNAQNPILGSFANVANGQRLNVREANSNNVIGSVSVHYGANSSDLPNMVVLKDFQPTP